MSTYTKRQCYFTDSCEGKAESSLFWTGPSGSEELLY